MKKLKVFKKNNLYIEIFYEIIAKTEEDLQLNYTKNLDLNKEFFEVQIEETKIPNKIFLFCQLLQKGKNNKLYLRLSYKEPFHSYEAAQDSLEEWSICISADMHNNNLSDYKIGKVDEKLLLKELTSFYKDVMKFRVEFDPD